MMDNGNGSSKSRAGVFFLAAGFAFTAMFENICGNAIAGGIDLAGLFPRYINIRRGAIITFVAAWIVQPWQLINKATTFVAVLSSFSVFLAPIIGIMACDYYLLRHRRIRLSHLYRSHDSAYYFSKGFNWRAIPAWVCGWAPTIGGLIVTVRGDMAPPRSMVQLYYVAFLIGKKCSGQYLSHHYTNTFEGFFISGIIFYVLNYLFPVQNMDQIDEVDLYGTFTETEARRIGIIPFEENAVHGYAVERRSSDNMAIAEDEKVV